MKHDPRSPDVETDVYILNLYQAPRHCKIDTDIQDFYSSRNSRVMLHCVAAKTERGSNFLTGDPELFCCISTPAASPDWTQGNE